MPTHGHVIVSPFQIRMARAALGWSTQKLAEHAGVAERTIRRLESADHRNMQIATYERVIRCLEQSGLDFLPADNGFGAGVRARHPKVFP